MKHIYVSGPGHHFTNGFSVAFQIRWKFRFTLISNLIEWSLKKLYIVRQLCCRGMCRNLSRSDGQQRNNSKAKFPSNLNYGQKSLVKRAPGHHWFKYWCVAYWAPNHCVNQCWLVVNRILENKLQWNANLLIIIKIQQFSIKKMRLNMSSAKWQPFCLGLNVLNAKKSNIYVTIA